MKPCVKTYLALVLLGDGDDGETDAGGLGQVGHVQVVLQPLVPLGVRRVHLHGVADRAQRLRTLVDARLHVDLGRQKAVRINIMNLIACGLA